MKISVTEVPSVQFSDAHKLAKTRMRYNHLDDLLEGFVNNQKQNKTTAKTHQQINTK